MSKLTVMAFPLAPEKKADWLKFTGSLMGDKNKEYKANRDRFAVRERTFLQQTPHGDMIIVTLEGENPEEAFAKFGQGTDEFTTWFKKEVMEIHGMDLGAPPPGPMPAMVVDSAK